jgi:hypothetical protein
MSYLRINDGKRAAVRIAHSLPTRDAHPVRFYYFTARNGIRDPLEG